MATSETVDFPFSVVSIVEDVLQQHSTRSSDVGLVSRKVEESCELLSLFLFYLQIRFVFP